MYILVLDLLFILCITALYHCTVLSIPNGAITVGVTGQVVMYGNYESVIFRSVV